MKILLAAMLALALLPAYSFACSPMMNKPANFKPKNADEIPVAAAAPEVSVDHINRGGDRPDSCSDIGRIVLSIAPDPNGYAYSFEVIEGNNPSDSFNGKIVVGYDSSGRQTFQFSWHEPYKAPPLNFKVRVTAFSKAGNRGGFSIVHIRDDGRLQRRY